jgi:DNA polymerase elongation subunit (family B)
MSKIIFGKDDTPNVTNISYKNGEIFIYSETDAGLMCCTEEFTPYILTQFEGKTSTMLEGNQAFKYITKIEDKDKWKKMWGEDISKARTIEESFMTKEGVTYFKNTEMTKVSILSFDIETLSLNPEESGAGVVLISNTYRNRDKIVRRLFDVKEYESEGQMLREWVKWVRQADPSIMCGHNIFHFDIPYLNSRYFKFFEKDLQLGRDGSQIHIDERTSKFRKDGSQSYDYHNAHIHGRELIDTMFLSYKYDIQRKFPSYGLKPIIQYLGFEKVDRIKWDFEQWTVKATYGNTEKWEQFKQYALDDADDALKLFDHMAAAFFYFNRSVPKKFQQMINEATGSQMNSILVRAYLQDGHSIAKADRMDHIQGAISFGIPGIYDNVFKIDVASLYPSIIRQYQIYNPEKDPKKYFLEMIEYFTIERLKNKKLAKETNSRYYSDIEQSQKIAINSGYGFLAAPGLNYNYKFGGSEVTRHGREILAKACQMATNRDIYDWKKLVDDDSTEEDDGNAAE